MNYVSMLIGMDEMLKIYSYNHVSELYLKLEERSKTTKTKKTKQKQKPKKRPGGMVWGGQGRSSYNEAIQCTTNCLKIIELGDQLTRQS